MESGLEDTADRGEQSELGRSLSRNCWRSLEPVIPREGGVSSTLRKIPLQHAAIDLRQFLQIGHRRALVDLVHGLADQAEFDNRAIARDEARVRGAAGGRELRLAAGDFLDRRDGEIGEGARFRDEYVGV